MYLIGYTAESSINHTTNQKLGESRGSSQLTFQQQHQNEQLGHQSTKTKVALTRCV